MQQLKTKLLILSRLLNSHCSLLEIDLRKSDCKRIYFARAGNCNGLNVETFRYEFTSEELKFIAEDIKQLEPHGPQAGSLKDAYHVLT